MPVLHSMSAEVHAKESQIDGFTFSLKRDELQYFV